MSSKLEMRRSKCYCMFLLFFYLLFFSLGNMCHYPFHNEQTNHRPDKHRASLVILRNISLIHSLPILYTHTIFTYYNYLQLIFTLTHNPNYLHMTLTPTLNPSNLQIISTPNPNYLQTIYINHIQTHTELSHLTYIPPYLKPTSSDTYGSQ